MDVIGTIASVIDLCVVTKSLIDKFQDAPKVITDLKKECEWTGNLCLGLKGYISQDPDVLLQEGRDGRQKEGRGGYQKDGRGGRQKEEAEDPLMWCFREVMSEIGETMRALGEELDKLETVDRGSRLSLGKRDRAMYMWREDSFKDASENMRRQRDMIGHVIQGIQMRHTGNLNNYVKGRQTPTPGNRTPTPETRNDVRLAEELYVAAKNGRLADVEALLRRGVFVDAALDQRGNRALHIAAQEGHSEVLVRLLASGAEVDVRNDRLCTPLHLALQGARPETAMTLLLQGADWRLASSSGMTALHVAAHGSVARVVQYLVGRGAEPNAPDADGRTPLFLACQPLDRNGKSAKMDRVTVWALVEHGADVGTKLKDGATVLHLAVKQRRPGLVKLLAGRGADMNAKAGDKTTPLQAAVEVGDVAMARLLLDRGARVDQMGRHNGTPLMHAARKGSVPWMRMLASLGAQPLHTAPQKTNAFIWACHAGHVACAAYLLGCGEDVDKMAASGYTALHYAASANRLQMVRWLLELGADRFVEATHVRVPFKAAGTAAQVARGHGHVAVAELIEKFEDEPVY
ncbi:ankyrin repeat protein [Colletotrichum sojae]|uniref:Ankyrin repeat protein n=1 Tax=Colletotrichum sojae TaxID=2175907 RepID=A0A8H6JIL9_9PEZI|nr:ankyrin repeat protein [Colletotrichum sojae]